MQARLLNVSVVENHGALQRQVLVAATTINFGLISWLQLLPLSLLVWPCSCPQTCFLRLPAGSFYCPYACFVIPSFLMLYLYILYTDIYSMIYIILYLVCIFLHPLPVLVTVGASLVPPVFASLIPPVFASLVPPVRPSIYPSIYLPI